MGIQRDVPKVCDHVSRYYDAEAMYAFVSGGKVKEHHLERWNPAQSEGLQSATCQLSVVALRQLR